MNHEKTTELESSDTTTLLVLLAAIFLVSGALAYEVALVVKITEFFGITDGDFGFLLAMTTIVLAVTTVPWGYCADKYSRIKLIVASASIVSVCMFIAGICFELNLPYWVFFATKLVSGIGMAGVGPVATSAVIDTVSLPKRGAAFGWVGVAWTMGGAGGIFLPSICMGLNLGIGTTFFVGSFLGLIAVILLLFVKEPRRGSRDEALKDTVGAEGADYDYKIKLSDITKLLAKPMNLLLLGAVLLAHFPFQVLGIWFMTFLMRNHGLPEVYAMPLTFLAFAGQPLGHILGGMATDAAYKRKRSGRVIAMAALIVLAPVFLIAAMLVPFKWIYFVPLMILANFFVVATGPGKTTVSLEVNLPEHRGTITALMGVFASVTRAFAFWIPPLIAGAFGGEYSYAFIITAAVFLPLFLLYVIMAFKVENAMDGIDRILADRSESLSGN